MVIRVAGGATLIYLGVSGFCWPSRQDMELSAETSTQHAHPLFGLLVNAHQSQGDRAVRQRVSRRRDRRRRRGWLMMLMVGDCVVAQLAHLVHGRQPVHVVGAGGACVRASARHWIERFAGVCFVSSAAVSLPTAAIR